MGGRLSRQQAQEAKGTPAQLVSPKQQQECAPLAAMQEECAPLAAMQEECAPTPQQRVPPPHASSPSMAIYVASILCVQRAIRRRLCVRRFMRKHEWIIFNELDLLNESDGLQLAHFMQTLLDLVPEIAAGATSSTEAAALDGSPRGVVETLLAGEEDAHGVNHVFYQTSSLPSASDLEFTITGAICPQQIIDVCRRGGRLSNDSLHKLMRHAYRLLLKMPNLNRCTLPTNSKLTIVGDIHGQLQDLLHIIDSCGLPSATNYYCFNGDWVDRGENSVEVITIILALFVAHPTRVLPNRGNHEDFYVGQVYGFQAECDSKYPAVHKTDPPNSPGFTFKMFAELFKHLPIATLINDSVFVVHGGLFDSGAVTLGDLDEITRAEYSCRGASGAPSAPRSLVPIAPAQAKAQAEASRQHYLAELMRQMLWSDPSARVAGTAPNPRGSGILFGADVALKFMRTNKLSLVVRSHECVDAGIDFPFLENCTVVGEGGGKTSVNLGLMGPNSAMLATLFSASDYLGGQNFGAFMTLMPHRFADATEIPGTGIASGLHFAVTRYQLGGEKPLSSLITSNRLSLLEVLVKSKSQLLQQFQAQDGSSSGALPRHEFGEILSTVTTIKIRWLAIISQLVPKHCLTPDGKSVLYEPFIDSLRIEAAGDVNVLGGTATTNSSAIVERLYVARKRLEVLFKFFDANGDGKISPLELENGCARLASKLSPESPHHSHLRECADLFSKLDIDHSGMIDVNEFFEIFRCLDSRDLCAAKR